MRLHKSTRRAATLATNRPYNRIAEWSHSAGRPRVALPQRTDPNTQWARRVTGDSKKAGRRAAGVRHRNLHVLQGGHETNRSQGTRRTRPSVVAMAMCYRVDCFFLSLNAFQIVDRISRLSLFAIPHRFGCGRLERQFLTRSRWRLRARNFRRRISLRTAPLVG